MTTGSPEAAAPGRIERGVQQLLAQERDHQQDDAPERGDLEDVGRGDPEDVAEQVAEQVGDVALDRAEQDDAEGEHPGEQDADGGIEAERPAPGDDADRQCRPDRGDRPADVQRDAEDEGDDQARERRMADGVADEREAAQDDERAHHRADDPDEDGGHQAALHEAVGHRLEEEVEHLSPPRRGSAVRRRATDRGDGRRR